MRGRPAGVGGFFSLSSFAAVFIIDCALPSNAEGALLRDCDAAVHFKAVFDRHRLHDTTAVPQANDHKGHGANRYIEFDSAKMKRPNDDRGVKALRSIASGWGTG